MIGNRVKVVLGPGMLIVIGVLHKIDEAGVVVYVSEGPVNEARGTRFFPMHRVLEVVDLGRAP
jgi:hypothetical protein